MRSNRVFHFVAVALLLLLPKTFVGSEELPLIDIASQIADEYSDDGLMAIELDVEGTPKLEWNSQERIELSESFDRMPTVPLYNNLKQILLSPDHSVAVLVYQFNHPTIELDEDGYAGRVQIVDSASGTLVREFAFNAHKTLVFDISNDGNRIITGPDSLSEFPRIDIWQLSDESAEHLVGWEVPNDRPGSHRLAKFVNNEKVVSIDTNRTVTIWELDPLRKAVVLPPNEVTGKPLEVNGYELTPDRSTLYAIIDPLSSKRGQLVAIDLVNYRVEGSIPCEVGDWLKVRPDGQQILLMAPSRIRLFDRDFNIVDEYTYQVPDVLMSVDWIDNRFFIMRSDRRLFWCDTVSRLPIWRYEYGSDRACMLASCSIVEGGLLSAQNRSYRKLNYRLKRIELDDPDAFAAIPGDTDEYVRVREGMTVSIINRAEVGDLSDEVTDRIRSQCERIGLRIVERSEDPDFIFLASQLEGEPIEVEYQVVGRRGVTRSAVINSVNMAMILYEDRERVWTRHTTSRGYASSLVMETEYQSLQDAVDQISGRVDPDFYLGLDLPLHIMRFPETGTIGWSELQFGSQADR